MRRYKVVKLVDNGVENWAVVSVSLREDETWDVINRFDSRIAAFDYVTEIRARNERIVAEA